jgi:hypothetical protein
MVVENPLGNESKSLLPFLPLKKTFGLQMKKKKKALSTHQPQILDHPSFTTTK